MAARRLLIAMLIFLGISTVLAAFAPPPIEEDSETTTSSTLEEAREEPMGGQLVRVALTISEDSGELSADRDTIRIQPGDQLSLAVRVPSVVAVEIPSLGLIETAAPGGPARFDLFATEPGTHQVVAGEDDQVVARIVTADDDAEVSVADRADEGSPETAAGNGARARSGRAAPSTRQPREPGPR